ncbi:uncharacterized protein Z518_00269 [Rhinocladiella mackenziei CBS 650.93]|uniref:Carboxymuconolactone decarboxylase-like domain-containing protein n=1 Tax=Rhinocladiella mackenziei CBS 650.93 TaxID=1442369 RepID=A0A0D2JIE3_9EURO|nr:uncharacterized protein Z518_00269 [Rhinocladiella mackenziei CBS 650.93]KIX09190.1 hypothetical protein Z518_00269 [Rhinocladiella mackenziei CBS 650.93]
MSTSIWDSDEFMQNWDKKYVSTNLKKGAKPYTKDFYLGLDQELSDISTELRPISSAILVVSSCAVGRADIAGRLFDDLTLNSPPEESSQLFIRLREAVLMTFPFLGLPNCIPACYGMIGVLERKGAAYGSTESLRAPAMTSEDVRKGSELRTKIYAPVGNSEIFGLMSKYFRDVSSTHLQSLDEDELALTMAFCKDNSSTGFTWGYLVSKANEEVFSVQQSHLIIAAAISALGATRQTRSHIKATLGLGWEPEVVKDVLRVVLKIADWANKPIEGLEVDSFVTECQKRMVH